MHHFWSSQQKQSSCYLDKQTLFYLLDVLCFFIVFRKYNMWKCNVIDDGKDVITFVL